MASFNHHHCILIKCTRGCIGCEILLKTVGAGSKEGWYFYIGVIQTIPWTIIWEEDLHRYGFIWLCIKRPEGGTHICCILSSDNCIARCQAHAVYFFSDIEKFPVIRVRQRYLYKYTLVTYKHIFLKYASNLEHLITVSANAEVQVYLPRLQGLVSCSTCSILPPFKYGKQRVWSWLAPRNGHSIFRLILYHSLMSPVQSALVSDSSWSAMGWPQE